MTAAPAYKEKKNKKFGCKIVSIPLTSDILPSTFCMGLVFVSNLGPVIDIKIAPIGAVTIILKIHISSMILANSCSSFECSFESFSKRLNTTGPKAA